MFKREKKPQFDEAAAAFESDVARCYGYDAITLALTGSRYFQGFNIEDGLDRTRSDVSCFFEAYGVVHEDGQRERHLTCNVSFPPGTRDDSSLGWLYLYRLDSEYKDRQKRIEEATLHLSVVINDPVQRYQAAVWQCLRDAALSDVSFIHLELGCDTAPGGELAVSELRAKGSTSSRSIIQFKLWPFIELPKSPVWARRS